MENRTTGIIKLSLVGAIVATLCDANHAFTETLSYPNPVFGLSPWYTYFAFVGAFVVMGYTYAWLAKSLRDQTATTLSTSRGTAQEFMETLSQFAFAYLLSGFGNRTPLLLAAILYGLFVLRLIVSYEKTFLVVMAIAMAIGGMGVEGAMSAAGLVAYREPEIFHVPWWLGAVYMHGAFALRGGMRFFVYR